MSHFPRPGRWYSAGPRPRVLPLLFALAALASGAAPQAPQSWGVWGAAPAAPAIPDIFTQDVTRFTALLADPLPERRVEGVQGLSHLKHWPAEDALLPLLADASPDVRREVVFALGRLGSAKSVPHLIGLLSDKAWEIRRHAHLALCRMTAQGFAQEEPARWQVWWEKGTPASREEALLRALEDPGSAIPRRDALRALRHLAGASAEGPVLSFLETPQEPPLSADERRFVVEILERIGTARCIPLLARQGPEAAWALGRIGGAAAEEALLRLPKTLAVLTNLDRLHSTHAAPFLDHLVNSFGLITYRSQPDDLHLDPTPIQRVAANLIRRSGEAPLLIELVLRELEATGAAPRDGGAGGAAPAPEVPARLAPILQRFREELRPGFVRDDGVTTSQPVCALYHVADDRALAPRLIPLLRHPAYVPRIYVAMLLAKLRAVEALPQILALIREGYSFPDTTALVSGKHSGQSQTVRWRGFICMALGRMGGEEARKALEALAADADAYRDIRYGAVVGLGFLGAPESLPVLRRVAEEDVIWMVRDTARHAAERIEREGAR